MATSIFDVSNSQIPAGQRSYGPAIVPAGTGIRVIVDNANLPLGPIATIIPYLSFDDGNTWEQQGAMHLEGSSNTVDHRGDPITNQIFAFNWSNLAGGILRVPDQIRVDMDVIQAFRLSCVIEAK